MGRGAWQATVHGVTKSWTGQHLHIGEKKNKQLGSFPPVPEYTAVDFLRFMPTACLLWKTGKPEPPKCRREKLFVFTLHRKENSI